MLNRYLFLNEEEKRVWEMKASGLSWGLGQCVEGREEPDARRYFGVLTQNSVGTFRKQQGPGAAGLWLQVWKGWPNYSHSGRRVGLRSGPWDYIRN